MPVQPVAAPVILAPTPVAVAPVTAAHHERGSVVPMTLVFVAIIFLLPFLIDYVAQLVAALWGPQAVLFFAMHPWLQETAAYVPLYLLMLFYLKTTFNPLAYYGYKWSREYLGWAVYIGVGSGIIIYFVDRIGGIGSLRVESFSALTFFGYLIGFVIFPAITEETLFRGVIQHFYQRRVDYTLTKYHVHIGILIASLFEIAFHLSAPIYYGVTDGGVLIAIIKHIPQILYVFVFGAIGGYLYQRTGSLVAPITIHALGNLTEYAIIWVLH